ncbi:hypothetical protein OF83DRAFT_198368 [Amylostereum chailletii]|nr:hypothetical protein OF83DRAFT_198368 [Amylostereum chailletii]
MSLNGHLNFLLAALFAFAFCAHAAPTFESEIVPRADGGGSSSSLKIWLPIVVVVIALALALGFRFRKPIGAAVVGALSGSSGHVTPPRNSNNGQPRELTAAEMTGTRTNPVSTAANNRSTRAPRRTRRTPSQISTMSLPAYMKEPGEHELVIIQGSQDLEDAPIPPTTVVMPVLDEEDSESTHTHARNRSNASSYVVVPQGDGENSHAGTPLLDEFNDNNDTNANVSSTRNDIDDSRAALLPDAQAPVTPDPRGEAPAYFEVIPEGEDGNIVRQTVDLTRNETRETLPIAPATSRSSEDGSAQNESVPTTGADAPRRRSVFRGLIHALNPRAAPLLPTSQGARPSQDGSRHTRDPSMATTAESHEPRRSNLSRLNTRSPTGHRPSHSGSGSMFSLSSSGFHRTMSRPSSSNLNLANLTSPSAISINSISAPLTHTLVRTDFVYPRSGPTPEQLKLISSREAVGKFGVPYGPDARAFAASASRVNLHGPPPEFEERPSIDGLPSNSSGHGRTRSGTSVTSPVPSPDTTASSNLGPSPDTSVSSNAEQALTAPRDTSPEADLHADTGATANADTDSSLDEEFSGPSHTQEATITQATSSSAKPTPELPEPPARLSDPSDASKTEASGPPSPTASRMSTISTASNLTAKPILRSSTPPPVPSPSSPPPSPPLSSSSTRSSTIASKKPASSDLTISVPLASVPTPMLSAKKSATALSAAPTSFRMPSTPVGGVRPESRASSVASFATAESHFSDAPQTPDIRIATATPRMGSPLQGGDEEDMEAETPSTPRVQQGVLSRTGA